MKNKNLIVILSSLFILMVQGNAAFANEAIIKSNATSENSSISEQEKLVKKELSDLMSEKNNLSKTDEGRKEEDLKNENSNKIINSIIWGASNNEKVEYFLRYFKTKVRERFKIWLSRSSKYLPLISKIFEEHGIAQELIFLPLIESGFSPYATSRAQAVGIWQFMKGTAIKYGLRVDKFVDERRDPEKSAEAAARYLKDLYNMFGSWDFALAAYNAGEGKIMRTMSSTGSKDFWDVIAHRKIKKETKEYVPRFVAATLIAKEPEEHGFDDVEYETNIEYEEVALPPKTTLSSIAKAIDVEEELIKNLNPSIKHGFLPPDTYYPVKVPKEKKELLLSKIHLLKTVDNKTFKKVMAMKEKKRFTKRKKAHKKIANAKRVNSDKRS